MIAINKDARQTSSNNSWQAGFLKLLPQIERHLQHAFRHLNEEAREEAVAEATALCLVAYRRLHQRGRRQQAFASSLARFAARQVSVGRQAATAMNCRDPLSRYAQIKKGIQVERLDRNCSETGEWLEPLVEDRRTSVPDQVALRIDVPQWLATCSGRKRTIAKDLAMGWSTSDIATKYGLSRSRISQLREELRHSWDAFHEMA